MAKKNPIAESPRKDVKKLVEKNLESLMVSLQPGINTKKISKKLRRAGKILVKAFNVKKLKIAASEQQENTAAV